MLASGADAAVTIGRTLPGSPALGCNFFHRLDRTKEKSPGPAGIFGTAPVDIVVKATQA
jgi:hypothetical protein